MTAAPLNPALFHLDPDHLWLSHCSDGPVPRSVGRGVLDLLHKEQWPWQLRWNEDFLGLPRTVREAVARVVDGQPEDISLTSNTSTGLQTIAQAFPWKAGDEVVAPLGEFPSNVLPWKALSSRGVTFHEVPLWEGHRPGWDSTPPRAGVDFESKLVRFAHTGARMLAVSWVRFQDGLKLDLARLGQVCRERDVCLVVDGIQGAGTAIPDLRGAGAFACGGHKGLLSPQGLGFLWTAPGLRRQLLPTGTWLSLTEAPGTRTWVDDGRRLEPGGPNLLACAALLEALKVLHEPGIAAIASHIQQLQGQLLGLMETRGLWPEEVRRLRALLEADRLGPFLAFHHGGRGPEAMQELLDRGLRRGIHASVREGYLRIAFHGWHEEGDLPRIVEWLDA
jgi:cysteine desulfurase / selenocysteine lyase